MKKNPINLISVLSLIGTAIIYNSYFGWHAWPASDAEMICDMLFSIMTLLVIITWKPKVKTE